MAEITNTNVQYLDMEGLQLYDSLIKLKIASDIKASEYDDTTLKALISANESAITTLNGEGAGSVKKQIDDAFNDFATKVSDDGVKNTFKELVDYCATHSAEAAEMAGDIASNTTTINELAAFVGKLPEDTDAKTVIEYINKMVGSVDFTEAITTAKSEAISTAAIDASTKSNKALEDSKVYTDTEVKALSDGQVNTNKTDIADLQTKVKTLETVTYSPITEAEINSLFSE